MRLDWNRHCCLTGTVPSHTLCLRLLPPPVMDMYYAMHDHVGAREVRQSNSVVLTGREQGRGGHIQGHHFTSTLQHTNLIVRALLYTQSGRVLAFLLRAHSMRAALNPLTRTVLHCHMEWNPSPRSPRPSHLPCSERTGTYMYYAMPTSVYIYLSRLLGLPARLPGLLEVSIPPLLSPGSADLLSYCCSCLREHQSP